MFLWELKNGIISQNLRELCVIETPKPNRKIPPTVVSTSSATVLFITTHAALACRRHIISIVLKSVCFLEHLWCSFGNSKTPSFQQNLRELCVIKANTNIPHIVASTSSATNSFITRCLSLSKAHYFYCIKIRVLKEYLRCSFGNSKTLSFHKIFVNFVILKQT